MFGFFAVAVLSGSLAEGLRSAGARLEQASTEIADLQAFNQHVIDSLPSGLATTDPRQRILTFNRAAEAITGLPVRAVVGPADRGGAAAADAGARHARSTSELASSGARAPSIRYRTADGRGEIDLGLSATHLQTPGGRAGFLFTFQDVTDIKKLERDARIQQRLAAVGEMAAGIAHEIRNPLASMSGSIQILRQELPLSAEQEQLMDIVLRESERLNNDDPVVSRLRAAAALRDRAVRRAARAERHGAAAAQQRRGAATATRSTSTCRTTSCGTRPTKGRSSRSSGTWRPTACARCPTAGGCGSSAALEPAVRGRRHHACEDEGVGIPAEELDALFQPFHGRFAKGSGLGLAIVHRIVTDYNGEIQVSSQPGAGTTVSVRLPARAGRHHMSTETATDVTPAVERRPAAHPRRRRRAVDARAAGDRAAARRLRGAARRERARPRSTCSSASRSTC